MSEAVKYGAVIPMPSGHVGGGGSYHSSLWPEDCHCQDYHLFCTHTLADALSAYLSGESG